MANLESKKLHFALVSPERELFSGDVDQVVIPGEGGEFGALALHAATMSVIKTGIIKIISGQQETKMYIGGGIADVTPQGVTILAEDAVDISKIDKAKITQDIKDLSEDVRDAKDDNIRNIASKKLNRLEAILAAA